MSWTGRPTRSYRKNSLMMRTSPDLPLTDITIDKSGCYGTFSLCYDTGDSPAGELYLNVSFDEQFVPSPKVGYDTF